MKTTMFAVVLVAVAAQAKTTDELMASGTPEEKGVAIISELGARNAGYRDMTGQVEMLLTDADGSEAKRGFSLKLLERAAPTEGDKSLIVFDTPADVKGTAVLSHAGGAGGEDEQWLFLPSARRTKRISSSNRSGSFVGSEFTFEDLTGNDARKYSWRALGLKPCGDSKCVELEAVPKDAGSAYSKRVLLLDQGDLRIRSIAFFDRKGEMLKTLSYDEYTKMNEKFLRAKVWTMKNAQTGKSTTIRFVAMKLSTGLSASDFSTGALGR